MVKCNYKRGDRLKIYRVVTSGTFGMLKEEHGFYLDDKKAIKKYKEVARKFQEENQRYISFDEYANQEQFRKPYGDKNIIKYIRIPYYYKCSYECEEYDETLIEFYVEEIEVID